MPRRPRIRSLTDRQLHQAMADAFARFSCSLLTREVVEACMYLEKLLDEEARRLKAGRTQCVCEACIGSRELSGQDWPDPL